MTADEFRDAMDNDKAFQSKRKALVFVSLLLLALVVSGAQIKEANTFIFKIEFANHAGLRYLLVGSVIACMLRYYSYSERYHNHLFALWSGRLLGDYTIYSVDRQAGCITGLLGKKVDVYCGDNYDVDNPVYRKVGFLKRNVGLPTSGMDEQHGEVFYNQYFSLNEYTAYWSRWDYIRLLMVEMKFRAQAWIKYRETLDLASPYLLGACSLLAYMISLFKA